MPPVQRGIWSGNMQSLPGSCRLVPEKPLLPSSGIRIIRQALLYIWSGTLNWTCYVPSCRSTQRSCESSSPFVGSTFCLAFNCDFGWKSWSCLFHLLELAFENLLAVPSFSCLVLAKKLSGSPLQTSWGEADGGSLIECAGGGECQVWRWDRDGRFSWLCFSARWCMSSPQDAPRLWFHGFRGWSSNICSLKCCSENIDRPQLYGHLWLGWLRTAWTAGMLAGAQPGVRGWHTTPSSGRRVTPWGSGNAAVFLIFSCW